MKSEASALETPINKKPLNGTTNKWVEAFLLMMDDSKSMRGTYDTDIERIDALIDEATEVEDPKTSPKKTNSQVIPLATHKAMAKTKFPTFWLESDTINSVDAMNVTSSLFYDFVDRTKLIDVYESKSGGMKRVYEVGDSLINYGIHEKTGMPIFSEGNFIKFYPSPFATEMRTASGERATLEGVYLFTYSWEQASKIFEKDDFKNKATIGDLPNVEDYRSGNYTAEQRSVMDRRQVQVAVGIGLPDEIKIIFAGSTAAPIRIQEGRDNKDPEKDFPHYLKDEEDAEPYFPSVHLRGILKTKGFPNYCFGQLLYKPALAERRNKNSGLVDMENNINALKVLQVGNVEASEWNKHTRIAREHFINRGKPGIIPLRSDQDQKVSLTDLRSEPLTGEFERTTEVINKDILRWFNIDSNITDTQKTLGALELEEESQDLILKQIARNNVEELIFALELLLNYLKYDIDLNDSSKENLKLLATPLTTQKTLKTGEEVFQTNNKEDKTLGALAELVQKHDIRVRMLGETGVQPSKTLRRMRAEAKINQIAQFNPQSPLIPKLMKQRFKEDGFNLSDEEAGSIVGGQPEQGQAPVGQNQINQLQNTLV